MCIYLRCFLQLKGATELGLGSLTVRLRALPEPAMQTSSGPGHSDPKATDEVEGMEDWTGVDDGYDDGGYFNMERYLTPPEPAPEAPKIQIPASQPCLPSQTGRPNQPCNPATGLARPHLKEINDFNKKINALLRKSSILIRISTIP